MSTDEAVSTETAPAEPAREKKQGSGFRIVLIILLILAVIALVIDRQARSNAQELAESLEAMLDESRGGETPTIDTVHQHINRDPDDIYDHDTVPNTRVEEYRHMSGLPWRNYTVYVYYRTKPDVRLDTVSLNQPLTKNEL